MSRLTEVMVLADADAEALRALGARLGAREVDLVEAFYRYLESVPEMCALLPSGARLERLREAQQAYLQALLSGDWSDETLASRRRLGAVHERAGVTPELHLAGYARHLRSLVAAAVDVVEPDRLTPTLEALVKVVFLDAAATLGAWFEAERRRLDGRRVDAATAESLETTALLARGIGHDLATPLSCAAVRLHLATEAVRDGVDPTEDLAGAEAAVTAAADIARGLLDLAGTARSEDDIADLTRCARDAAEIARPQLLGTELVRDIPTWPVAARAAPMAVVRVLLNLVLNAHQAIEEASVGGRVTIRVGSEAERAWVEVEDDGPGIPLEIRDRLFEPYVTARRSGTGSGLGLAVVQRLVHGAGGEVHFASRAGGTTFRVDWRAAPMVIPPPARVPIRRIVLVEDDRALRRALERVLGRAAVRSAGTVAEARALITAWRPDAVVVDHGLPDGAGLELAASLVGRVARVVVLSGTPLEGPVPPGVVAVAKPCSVRELLAALGMR